MEILKDRYTITELSERLGITDHALRYYEKEFNLSVPKDSRGRRYYTPEYANLMFQIKTMRDDGLEIKAIKKIFESENTIIEPPPVVSENEVNMLAPFNANENIIDIKNFFNDFGDRLTLSFSTEVATAREQINMELNKTKLELGACVENNIRKIENKLDKHFENVDRSLGLWRERNKGGFFNRLSKIMSKRKTM